MQMSRSQKAKANKRQQNILQSIVIQNQELQKYGEPYVLTKTVKEMQNLKLLTQEQANECYDLLYLSELFRQINNSLKSPDNKRSESEIDTSKLHIGMVVENYKELCNLLGVNPQSGEAKQKQEKKFLRYFDFEKCAYSNEIVILDIYLEPIPTGAKGSRNSLFANQLKVLILKEMTRQKPNNEGNLIYYTSYSRLIQKLHLVNQYFHSNILGFFVEKFPEWAENDADLERLKQNYLMFKRIAFRKIKGAVEYALSSLKRDELIWFDTYNVVGVRRGKTIKYERATTDEEIYITALKKEIAVLMGYSNSLIASLYEPDKFNELFTNRFKSEMNWEIVYFQVEIGTKQDTLKRCMINEYTAFPLTKSIFDLSEIEEDEHRKSCAESLATALKKQTVERRNNKLKNLISELKERYPYIMDLTDEEIIEIYKPNETMYMQNIDEYGRKQNVFIDYLIETDAKKTDEMNDFLKRKSCK